MGFPTAARAVQPLCAQVLAHGVVEPKSGSYPVAGSASMGLDGPNVGAILSLT
jgi:hypothetical protein